MKDIWMQECNAGIALALENKEKERTAELAKSEAKLKVVDEKLAQLPRECVAKAYPIAQNRPFNKEDLKETWEKLRDRSASGFLKRVLKVYGYGSKKEMLEAYAVNVLSLKFYLEKQTALRLERIEQAYDAQVEALKKELAEKLQTLEAEEVPVEETVETVEEIEEVETEEVLVEEAVEAVEEIEEPVAEEIPVEEAVEAVEEIEEVETEEVSAEEAVEAVEEIEEVETEEVETEEISAEEAVEAVEEIEESVAEEVSAEEAVETVEEIEEPVEEEVSAEETVETVEEIEEPEADEVFVEETVETVEEIEEPEAEEVSAEEAVEAVEEIEEVETEEVSAEEAVEAVEEIEEVSAEEAVEAVEEIEEPETEEVFAEEAVEAVEEIEEVETEEVSTEETVEAVEEIEEPETEEVFAEETVETVEEIEEVEAEEVSAEETVETVEEIEESVVEEVSAEEAVETVEEIEESVEEEVSAEETVETVEEIEESVVEEVFAEETVETVEEIEEPEADEVFVEETVETVEEIEESVVEEVFAEETVETVEEIEEVETEEVSAEEAVEAVEEIEEPVAEEIPVEETYIFESYSKYRDLSVSEYKDGTNGLELPVLLGLGNDALASFTLGTAENAHVLITGDEKSGKDALLHSMIASVISDYHPDDAEIWLLDYGKKTFAPYLTENTKHIRFISLENAMDFTESFLMFLHKFFSRRENMFRCANASDIKQYREKCGKNKMPRVILIANDAQIMTRSLGENIVLRNLLESALDDYKRFGLSCIFCASSADAVDPLTETGKAQFSCRIAMKNELREMTETLGISEENLSEDARLAMESTKEDELWMDNGSLFRYQMFAISENDRTALMQAAENACGTVKEDTFFFALDGLKRRPILDAEMQMHIANTRRERTALNLCLGDPVQISLAFHIYLLKKAGQNILLTGKDTENTFDILASVLRSASFSQYKTVVLADANDPYTKLVKALGIQNLTVLDDINEIAAFIARTAEELKDEEADLKTFIVWLGAQRFGFDADRLWNGGRNGVLNLVAADDARMLSDLDLSLFDHKLSAEMDKEVLRALGYPAAQLDHFAFNGVNAVYSNGAKLFAFKPYTVKTEEKA